MYSTHFFKQTIRLLFISVFVLFFAGSIRWKFTTRVAAGNSIKIDLFFLDIRTQTLNNSPPPQEIKVSQNNSDYLKELKHSRQLKC